VVWFVPGEKHWHPEFDRFGAHEFQQALTKAGLVPQTRKVFRQSFAWFTAIKP
jgi:hypothetical protein